MKIEIFVSNACPHREAAKQLVDEAAQEAGVQETPAVITVNDYEDAKAKRMFGSPTVRVNGMDIEYAEREPEEFTTGCRFYNSAEGWKPLPRKELILRGIEVARAREARAAQG
jgi:glutaredoxin